MKKNKELGKDDPTLGAYYNQSGVAGAVYESTDAHTKKSEFETTSHKVNAKATFGATSENEGYIAGGEAWVGGNKMGIGGKTRQFVGIEGEASAAGASNLGPRIGEIDPKTGERKGIANFAGGTKASASAGLVVSGQGEAYVQGLDARAAGKASAGLTAEGSVAGSGSAEAQVGGVVLAGAKAGGGASAALTAAVQGEGDVSVGLGGAKARGQVSAEAVAKAGAQASGTLTVLGAHIRDEKSASAEAGAKANAQGSVALGAGTVGAAGSVEAFAGAKASVTGKNAVGFLGVDVFSAELSASVAAGVGGELGGGIMINDGVMTINFDVMAAAGGGLGLAGKISFDAFAGFKMILSMLEKNGVISSDIGKWIPDIITKSASKEEWEKKMAGRPDKMGHTHEGEGKATYTGASRVEGPAAAAPVIPGAPAMPIGITPDLAGLGASFGDMARPALDLGGDMSRGGSRGSGRGRGRGRSPAPTPKSSGKMPMIDGKQSQDKALAMAKLTEAHCLAAEANTETSNYMKETMENLKNGIGDPVKTIMAIMTGGGAALASTVLGGLKAAGAMVGQVAKLAAATVDNIANMVMNFFQMLFGGGIGALFNGYGARVAEIDAKHAKALTDFQTEADAVRQQSSKEIMDAIKSGLLGIANEFIAQSADGGKGAKQKAEKAQKLVGEVEGTPFVDEKGDVYKVQGTAKNQMDQLVGTLNGADSAGKKGMDAITGAGSEMGQRTDAELGAQAADKKRRGAPAIDTAYSDPKAKVDADIKKKQQAAG